MGSSSEYSSAVARGVMKDSEAAPKDIDEYIARFPHGVQEILEKIRMTIRRATPEAGEKISYQIPTFTLKGKY